MAQALTFLAFMARDVEGFRLLRRVRVLVALVDAEIAEDLPEQRAARQHALDGLLDDALGEAALEDELRRALLDAARIAGVVVVDLLVALAAGEDHLVGVDDDDVVAAVDMGRVGRLVLAAQPHRHDRGEPADDEALRIDHHPLLVDVGGFQRSGFHRAGPVSGRVSPVETTNRRESRGGDGRI